MTPSIPDFLKVDDDLREKEAEARLCVDKRVYDCDGLVAKNLERTLEVLIDASKAEQDREANLNARGAAVATVAALVVSVSGAVAKSVFETTDWTDWTKFAAILLFLTALFAVAAAMVMAVVMVLRPGQGPQTKNLLGETLVELWLDGKEVDLIEANRNRLNLLFVDRCFQTLPSWHYRNRRKARWLRRSWVFLGAGIVLIAAAAVLVLAQQIGIVEPDEGGFAADLSGWHLAAIIAALAFVSWAVIKRDVVRAATRDESAKPITTDEVATIAGLLRRSPLREHG
jgi:hypothetical protein